MPLQYVGKGSLLGRHVILEPLNGIYKRQPEKPENPENNNYFR